MLGLGVLGLFSNLNISNPEQSGEFVSHWAIISGAALLWYLVTRWRTWWHHD
jgi:hypothetical protein